MDANRRSEGAEFVSRACSSGLHVKALTLGLENPGNSGRSDVAKIWGVRVGGDKASKTGHREVVKAPESHVKEFGFHSVHGEELLKSFRRGD